jgi:hypothetical protein
MNYAVEMGSGGMIYIPRFIRLALTGQKLIRGYACRHIDTDTQSAR